MLSFLPLLGNLAGRLHREIPMTAEPWTAQRIRALAHQYADGKTALSTARGAYLRALIETTQAALGGKADTAAQLAALKRVHREFSGYVEKAIATDEILLAAGVPRKSLGQARNRRMNFVRTQYGPLRAWLRVGGHDLIKLDSKQVTKSQLVKEGPPPRKHVLTQERINRKSRKLVEEVTDFARQVAKADHSAAVHMLKDAIERLQKQLGAYTKRSRAGETGHAFERRLAA